MFRKEQWHSSNRLGRSLTLTKKMKLNKKIIIASAIIVSIIAISYLMENITKNSGLQKGTIITVIQDSQPIAYMDISVFKELMKKEYQQDTGTKGPSLVYVLSSAGAGNYKSIEIKSVQRVTDNYIIKQQDVNNTFIFYFTDHNTVNLIKLGQASTTVAEDVSEIIVETKE